jgi:tetratricopeptide (TPR) repeat protein
MSPAESGNADMNRNQHRPDDQPARAVVPAASPIVQSLFAAAVGHHQAGHLDEAEHLFRQVLAADPRHADSLHLLGVIAHQTGRHDLAVDLMRQAIASNATPALYHANLGGLLQQRGRLDEAVACYRTAIGRQPDYPAVHTNLGNALREQGLRDEAIASYRRSIECNPDYPEAYNNLGVALLEQGRLDEAIACYRRAIGLKPNYPGAHNNLGNALKEQGRLDEAVACYRTAIDLQPAYPEAHNNLGIALQGQGRSDDAVASFRTAVDLKPDDPETHINLGIALKEQGRLDEAAACYGGALDLQPDFPEAHYNRGNVRGEQGRLAEAVGCYRRAIELRPDYPGAHVNLGNALREQGLPDQAIPCYRNAIELKPDYPEAHNNLGIVLLDLGWPDEAIACGRKAIALKPDYVEAYSNLGTALRAQGRLDEAVASYRESVGLKPDYPEAHSNLAMALLARGDMAEGWAEYEWRWKTPHMLKARRDFAQAQWHGEPAAGRTLLIHAEQGLGDTLQFCRYAPLAAASGLRVILEVPRSLVRLLCSLPGIDQVVAQGEALPQFDLHCPMLSLPLALGTTSIAGVPGAVPYLHAGAAQIAAWRSRLAVVGKAGPRVGLVWAGNPRKQLPTGAAVDRRRSIAPERLAPLFELPGLHFVSLQKDGTVAPADFPLTDIMDEVADFADTAALIANLDLVISVDTSVAHLAGALGKPVWLLDRFDPCWRWLVGQSNSPWYPTLRLFRQPDPGNWQAVIENVRAELGLFVSGRSPDAGLLDPMPDVQGLFADAVRHHQAGRLADAEPLYRQVLAANPRHADALHLLGVIGGQTGRPDLAADMIGRAIAIKPKEASFHCNLGISLKQQHRLDDAVACFRTALDLKPDYPEAHNNLGIALKEQARLDEAIACYRTAIGLNPNYSGAHNNLGIALRTQGWVDEAVACFQRAIDLDPNYPGAHNNLGIALKEQARLDEAVACFRKAIEINPNHAAAHNNLGIALKEQARLDEAVGCFRRALDLTPDFAEAHNNLGTVLGEQARQEEAVACYRQAIDLKPDFSEAHNNLGTALRARQRLDDAVASYRRAIGLDPDYADAHNNLAMALLARGDMAAGWEEYEWRWRTPQTIRTRRDFTQPQWRGEHAEGRTLLIHAEQGLGDTIQFCRYAPLAAARGLRVILEVPGPLVRLLRGLPGVERVLERGETLPQFDLHCPMLSIPLAVGTTITTIPSTVPYLCADAVQVAAWRTRLADMDKSGPRIGLVWAGSSRRHSPTGAALDGRRSIAPDRLAPLLGLSGLHFFSLQKDGPAAPEHFRLTDVMNEMADFADTAALIANLDLVVSVDTSVAHLAGALGKPVWLLDRFDPCWRWLVGRRDSPWYPTLRLYRQPHPGDWDAVLAEVARDLHSLARV